MKNAEELRQVTEVARESLIKCSLQATKTDVLGKAEKGLYSSTVVIPEIAEPRIREYFEGKGCRVLKPVSVNTRDSLRHKEITVSWWDER